MRKKSAGPSRQPPFRPDGPLPFGQLRTDHMFLMDYEDGRWIEPRIVPYGPLSLAPGAVALHYAQEIFEGAKAFLHDDGEIHAFRIDKNASRLNRSGAGVLIPPIPEDATFSMPPLACRLQGPSAPPACYIAHAISSPTPPPPARRRAAPLAGAATGRRWPA